MKIEQMPKRERPRERLIKEGCDSLSLVELVAVLLGSGVQGEGVVALSEKLVGQFGSVTGLCRASLEELMSIKGIGMAKALLLKSALGLSQRYLKEKAVTEEITGPEDIYTSVRPYVFGKKEESLLVVLRDVRGRMIDCECVGKGLLSEVLVHPREVFAPALQKKASSLVLIHNHPSGDIQPSKSDDAVTRQLLSVGAMLQIALDDHLIVSDNAYYSYWQEGKIQRERY